MLTDKRAKTTATSKQQPATIATSYACDPLGWQHATRAYVQYCNVLFFCCSSTCVNVNFVKSFSVAVCVVFFFAVFLETGAWHCHRQHRQHPPNSQVLDSTALFNDFPDEPENSSVFAKQSREWVSCFEKFIDSGRGLPNWISVPRKFMCSWLKLRNCEMREGEPPR